MELSRRRFLHLSLSSSGALVVGVTLPGCAPRSADGGVHAPAPLEPNAWIRVERDSKVVFVLDRVEMGQGTWTSHAAIVAEELGLEASELVMEMAGADRAFDHPEYGLQITGGSSSLRTSWEPLRNAAAHTREILKEAAARKWKVERAGLELQNAAVVNRQSGERASFGELVEVAHLLNVEVDPAEVRPLDRSDYRLLGTSVPRLDAPSKVDGRASFGIDVQLPGMLAATVVRPPALAGEHRSFDEASWAEALAAPGVRAVFAIDTGVAVVAETYWQARVAARLVKLDWDAGETASLSSETLQQHFEEVGVDDGDVVREDGDFGQAFAEAPEQRRLSATYDVPYLAHATLEPQTCTVSIQGDRCEIWAPTQSPGMARELVAAHHGFSRDNVIVHQTLVGGGFGRRLLQDYVVEAVAIARQLRKPVKVLWSREQDTQHDFYRPKGHHVMQAVLGESGKPQAWRHRVVSSSILGSTGDSWVRAILPDWLPQFLRVPTANAAAGGMASGWVPDDTTFEGAADMPYGIANLRVECAVTDPGVPLGFWRSVGHSGNAFPVECFIDELAHLAGQDAFEFRRALLTEAPRHRRVLELAASRSGWGSSLPQGVARGIAQHASFESFAAQVVEASVEQGKVRVHRVVCAVDCGFVVNPDIVRAQIEGGIVFGLSAALHQEITLEAGAVEQGNFDSYPLLRMNEVPEIEVHIVESDEPPTGIGEPGVPPIAPALANALFEATGKRVRKLPLASAYAV